MTERSSEGGPVRPLLTPSSDDFLYHLYRGSTMLLQDQVVEAKEELERALSLQPQDAKSQDLLAGVYFRLGFYPRAIEIWDHLVAGYPRDATLRVNLALALFKTGQGEDALDHVHEALRIQPDHERAWGYLGLIHWRLGHLAEARDAFLRGGQASMARRMEEAIHESEVPEGLPQDELAAQDREAMRNAAEAALEQIDTEQLSLEASQGKRGTGAWALHQPGEEHVPAPFAPPTLLEPPSSLRSALGEWTATVPAGVCFATTPSGALFVNAERDVNLRMRGLSAIRGEFRCVALRRRAQGRELRELLGGDEPISRWHAPFVALVEPAAGEMFFVLELEGELLALRESALFGFADDLRFESASLPVREPLVVTQLEGAGAVVLSLPMPPRAFPVGDGDEVRVEPARLLGWAGRLVPRVGRGTAPYSAGAPRLVFRGEGVVLLRG